MTSLATKKCVPCEGGVPKLDNAAAAKLGEQIPAWSVGEALGSAPAKLHRRFTFPDFRAAMAFVNAMADVAEAEAHHPDFTVHYNRVDISIWTHAIGGLSENDFILASKLDRLPLQPAAGAPSKLDRLPLQPAAGAPSKLDRLPMSQAASAVAAEIDALDAGH